jgi:hypothetical protein
MSATVYSVFFVSKEAGKRFLKVFRTNDEAKKFAEDDALANPFDLDPGDHYIIEESRI